MFISVFDMFKIGVGPSSSHTLGPMKAGKQFVDDLQAAGLLSMATRVQVDLYGSLSSTGKGHATDSATISGLAGNVPDTVDIDSLPGFLAEVERTEKLPLARGAVVVDFSATDGVRFNDTTLPLHENGMTITAYSDDMRLFQKTYYSVGGGFIVDEDHFNDPVDTDINIPYPYASAEDVLRFCRRDGISIAQMQWRNELAIRSEAEVRAHLAKVWEVMSTGIKRGTTTEGILPGPLQVPRRAAALAERLESKRDISDPLIAMSWLNLYALAVTEENASGGRVVTAPTNGACGICPSVLAYYGTFFEDIDVHNYTEYFLAANVIGALYKMNASLSGAEVGCQGEVGVACSMAAAGFAQLRGGTPEQVCTAAEIGMEHNLGLTCDPVLGQVQVPCIERNAMASVKAVNAASMALSRDSQPCVGLDAVIETMYRTGKDMDSKYRETSLGGLACAVCPAMPCS